ALASRPAAVGTISPASGLLWLALSIGLGLLAALLLRELLPERPGPQVNLALILGVVAFFSGAAGVLRLSPLFLGVAAGAAFCNLSVRKESVYELLGNSERTIYVLFLLAVGALWNPQRLGELTLVALLYVIVRGVAKVGGFAALAGLGRNAQGATPARIGGLGLIGQGGLALAMALDYQRAFPGDSSSAVLSVMILALLINELLAWGSTSWLLKRRGIR
ncbi:MAG: hypothetical protein P9M14_12210, partial [Candidatus Alcyoniella australis]|nr:hypothetical protein [Candidatus Alcyoniella australis]